MAWYIKALPSFLSCNSSLIKAYCSAQCTKNSDTNGEVLNITTVRTNFECFNECIKNPFCQTAISLAERDENCKLISKTTKIFSTFETENEKESIQIIGIFY